MLSMLSGTPTSLARLRLFRASEEFIRSVRICSSSVGSDFFPQSQRFADRHIGPTAVDRAAMLDVLGFKSISELVEKVVPDNIRLRKDLTMDKPLTEVECLKELSSIADQNEVWRSYIGLGFYNTHTPSVILRNILENAGWTTPYTPYQAEIAQGRLESLLNFQTMICDLTGLPYSNASLLDEATAAAEAISLACRYTKRNRVLISSLVHPQNLAVMQSRAAGLGVECVVGNVASIAINDSYAAVVFQYPDTNGDIVDHSEVSARAHAAGALSVSITDIMSLLLLRPPAEIGADIAVGSCQRFGVPLGYGGPHAAFFSAREHLMRQIPGRMVGVTKDPEGKKCFRLTLQTREQHIRRDKATSNICTAQALLANISAMYAIYHGPQRLRQIATRIHHFVLLLRHGLQKSGYKCNPGLIFDTVKVNGDESAIRRAVDRAAAMKINFRVFDSTTLGVSLDETVTQNDLDDILSAFCCPPSEELLKDICFVEAQCITRSLLARTSPFLTHEVFNTYHSEAQITRYIKSLENRDISLVHSMIPLGSCTMKLNAATEMRPLTWKQFTDIHPFVPPEQAKGYHHLFRDLETSLCEITGFDAVSLQSNSGAQGEYNGLMTIMAYLKDQGESQRRVCLIPRSAHGTNPASAQVAGYKIEVVEMDSLGGVDMQDLKKKAEKHRSVLGCVMVTYPSTSGVFEEGIREICDVVHSHGGQVYLDGANMNAQVGLCRPGDFGADVCHLNLHKTFCIPHGGGGPGMGPICVKRHLAPYLPSHPLYQAVSSRSKSFGAISSSMFASSLILTIPWAYIKMMGSHGLRQATEQAILNANYMAARLGGAYHVLFKGSMGFVAHEFILDLKEFKKTSDIDPIDVAKRLMDFGFHAPTVSWPVGTAIMIEPTESEDKEELDRFCTALLTIREEIRDIEQGRMDRKNNPLKNAPHTQQVLLREVWDRPYSRQVAAFPAPWLNDSKVWPTCGRVNDAYGDQHVVCTCPPMDSYL